MSKFKVGDEVQVNAGYNNFEGHVGLITRVINEQDKMWYAVSLYGDNLSERGFFEHELDFTNTVEAGLVDLAEKLDAARLLANSIEPAAPQGGVYGHIATGLWHTLYLILGSKDEAEAAYGALLNGSGVREALKTVRGY